MARVSHAQEVVTKADRRLALVYLALEHGRSQNPRELALNGDLMDVIDAP